VSSRNKITVDIQGGLGNQLFCYSAGLYVALKNSLNLECRMTTQNNSIARKSTILSSLNLPGSFVASRQIPISSNSILNRVLRKLIRKFKSTINFPFKRTYNSNSVGYDKKIESLDKPVHLNGYFQTWRYPRYARDTILLAIQNEVDLCDYAEDLINQMNSKKILAVHIRLGDYKNSENSYIGVLSPEYYGSILNRPELGHYQVFVFSDDISDARSQYGKYFPSSTTWIDEDNILDSLETMVVMSHGKAFAIANSTFSWWSAFLSQDSEIIIAPSKWFKEKDDPEDLIPSNWQREVSQWAN